LKEKKQQKKAEQAVKKAARVEKEKAKNQKIREKERDRRIKFDEETKSEIAKIKNKAISYKDPMIPKRSSSAFFIFSQSRREKLKSEKSSLPITEMGKLFGQEWKQLTPEQKQPFIKQAEEEKAKSTKARQEYLAANPIPKSPPGPYMLFIQDRYSSVRSSLPDSTTPRDKIKKVGETVANEWKALSDEAKEKYRQKYHDARAAYEKQLKTWTDAQIDKMPESVKHFAKEAIEGGHFKKPKEIKIVLGDLTKAAARE